MSQWSQEEFNNYGLAHHHCISPRRITRRKNQTKKETDKDHLQGRLQKEKNSLWVL